MSRNYDGFTGPADTPYVVSAFPPEFKEGDSLDATLVHYCMDGNAVYDAVKSRGVEPTVEQMIELIESYGGDGVTIDGWEFSIEREF